MSYSEEEIQKYLNILHSFNGTYDNTVFYDTILLKTPEKRCLVIIAVIFILSKMVVLVIVINVFIQMVMLLLMK